MTGGCWYHVGWSCRPHTHARLGLASGRELRFVEPAAVWPAGVFATWAAVPDSPAPGAEPLTITADENLPPCSVAGAWPSGCPANQSLQRGGNIYADESLFRAGIRSATHAGRLTGRIGNG